MMIITVHARPSASRNAVEKMAAREFIVRTVQPPVQGRANRAIIELLAAHLNIAPSRMRIVSGRTSRTKRIAMQ